MNNLYIHVSDALTIAATCDGYLLAYKTLDYSNAALEEVYTTFSCIEFDNAFVVFDGRPSMEQYEGAVQAFCLEVDGKKVYGNVNAEDIDILYRLLKGMGIQNVQMFDYSVAMLLTAGESACLYRSYEKYLLFRNGKELLHYAEAGDEVFQYARKSGLLVFGEEGIAIADLFKENFLTEKQRRKLACFAIALAYCQPYQIKPSAGEATVQEIVVQEDEDQSTILSVETESLQEEALPSEEMAIPETPQVDIEEAAELEERLPSTSKNEEIVIPETPQVDSEIAAELEERLPFTSKLVVSRPDRFKRISADKVDLLNLPEYCKIEIDFDLVRRQMQQRKEGREVEKSTPVVLVDLDKYDKVLRTEGDVLNLYPVPGSTFTNLEMEGVAQSKSDGENEYPEKAGIPGGGSFNPLSLLDTSFLSEDTEPEDKISQTENTLTEQSAEELPVEESVTDTEMIKHSQTEGDILATDVQSIEETKSLANADFSGFMQTIHKETLNNRSTVKNSSATADVIAQTERNAKLGSLNYVTAEQVKGEHDLQLFDDTAILLNDEEFDPAQANEFNAHVAMAHKRKGSSIGFAILSIVDVLLIGLLVFSFFSEKFIRTTYTDEEKQILNACRTMAEFRGYADALLTGKDSEIIEEMTKVGSITQIIRMDVYTNGMHESRYVVHIPEWTTPEKVISELQLDYPGAEISGMSNQRLCSIIISRQKGVDQ